MQKTILKINSIMYIMIIDVDGSVAVDVAGAVAV